MDDVKEVFKIYEVGGVYGDRRRRCVSCMQKGKNIDRDSRGAPDRPREAEAGETQLVPVQGRVPQADSSAYGSCLTASDPKITMVIKQTRPTKVKNPQASDRVEIGRTLQSKRVLARMLSGAGLSQPSFICSNVDGEQPPKQIADWFHTVESLSAVDSWQSAASKDVCLGFCYDPAPR
jgi:hypothetical protein